MDRLPTLYTNRLVLTPLQLGDAVAYKGASRKTEKAR